MLKTAPLTGDETVEFPLVELGDDASQRGEEHGSDLRERIGATIDCYGKLFDKPEAQVFELASHFRREIKTFLPLYAKEIEGIASGAKVNPLWIYALNSRTEILSPAAANECTAATFPQESLIGQTWDWAEEMEKLAVIMKIERETRPDIVMLTEPGIIGKIGMNSRGLGVCLNIVKSTNNLRGVPIHIMLRSILDEFDLDSAQAIAEGSAEGKSSNVIVADKNGKYFNIAYADGNGYTVSSGSAPHAHTNHFNQSEASECSMNRLMRSLRMIQEMKTHTHSDMVRLLSDEEGQYPILSPYAPQDILGGRSAGTVATVVMNVREGTMHVRKGNKADNPFVEYSFGESKT